jgi:hypothetical protein
MTRLGQLSIGQLTKKGFEHTVCIYYFQVFFLLCRPSGGAKIEGIKVARNSGQSLETVIQTHTGNTRLSQ